MRKLRRVHPSRQYCHNTKPTVPEEIGRPESTLMVESDRRDQSTSARRLRRPGRTSDCATGKDFAAFLKPAKRHGSSRLARPRPSLARGRPNKATAADAPPQSQFAAPSPCAEALVRALTLSTPASALRSARAGKARDGAGKKGDYRGNRQARALRHRGAAYGSGAARAASRAAREGRAARAPDGTREGARSVSDLSRERAPDYHEPFLGWRVWLLTEDRGGVYLRSIFY
jgi:hypothetical protein